MLSDDEPRGGNVSGVLFIDADGEIRGTGPSKPSPWAMMPTKLFWGVCPRSIAFVAPDCSEW